MPWTAAAATQREKALTSVAEIERTAAERARAEAAAATGRAAEAELRVAQLTVRCIAGSPYASSSPYAPGPASPSVRDVGT